ncbi:hypothetical protein Plhal304r1_c083g0167931 [Plasmopara halstedii]
MVAFSRLSKDVWSDQEGRSYGCRPTMLLLIWVDGSFSTRRFKRRLYPATLTIRTFTR